VQKVVQIWGNLNCMRLLRHMVMLKVSAGTKPLNSEETKAGTGGWIIMQWKSLRKEKGRSLWISFAIRWFRDLLYLCPAGVRRWLRQRLRRWRTGSALAALEVFEKSIVSSLRVKDIAGKESFLLHQILAMHGIGFVYCCSIYRTAGGEVGNFKHQFDS
jgi:hypothetical protein